MPTIVWLQTWGRVTHSGALLYWEIVPDKSAKVQRARVMRADLVEGSPPQTVIETDIESDIRLSGGVSWRSSIS